MGILFLKAEKYGQFADNTARVVQEREKQKGVEKRHTREIKYYRQGAVIANHPAAIMRRLYTVELPA